MRTREILRQWGIEERFLDAGELWRSVVVHDVDGSRPLLSLSFSELSAEADQPGLLVLEQNETERLLLEAVRESELCDVRFDSKVVGLEQDDSAVHVVYRSGDTEHTLHAAYAVGCDGAGSFVRDALSLPFDDLTYTLRPLLADVRVSDSRNALPQPRALASADAFHFAARLRDGLWRIVHLPPGEPEKDDVEDEEAQRLVDRLIGPGPVDVAWANRFRIHVRSSPRLRIGRVLLAGDAAHVHSPASGFGMNGGIQDAHNLAWRLAGALGGGDVERLLDSYEVERHDVVGETTAQRMDRITRIFIQAPALVRQAAWLLSRPLMRIRSVRMSQLRRTAMLNLDYPASPLLRRGWRARGRRLPNPLLRSPDGHAARLYELLPYAPVMLDIAEERPFAKRPAGRAGHPHRARRSRRADRHAARTARKA